MKNEILFVSDTHIDHKLRSGTTPISRAKLRDIRGEAIISAVIANKEGATVIDAGDLFHSSMVSDNVGLSIAMSYTGELDYIITGNHDWSNREDKLSTLNAISRNIRPEVFFSPFSSEARLQVVDGVAFLPHVRNQEVFLRGLQKAIDSQAGFLVTHCNILLGDKLLTPTTLNLDQEWMDKLAKRFTRVFIGHNHKPAEYNNGKIVSIGTPYPSSFSDCHHDCRVVRYNRENDTLESIYTYRAADNYLVISPEDPVPSEACPPFVRVIGKWNPERIIQVYEQLYDAGALAVKVEGVVGEEVDTESEEVLKALSSLDFEELTSSFMSEEDKLLLAEIKNEI